MYKYVDAADMTIADSIWDCFQFEGGYSRHTGKISHIVKLSHYLTGLIVSDNYFPISNKIPVFKQFVDRNLN